MEQATRKKTDSSGAQSPGAAMEVRDDMFLLEKTSGENTGKMTETNSKNPGEFSRRILLAVTGLSPQVVTETLYALAIEQNPPFIPTEIHLVTTAEGAERARLMLFEHEGGRFHRLCDEYGVDRDAIDFGQGNIHVVHDALGEPLSDIVDQASSAAVADLITGILRELTADENCAVHASIAGGRKTMGFYLGYALSLYGRPQDRLSHVLVSSPFESDHQFYYPPATPTTLIIKDRPVRANEARILLADIPFVRLRDSLPEDFLADGASFSQTVSAAQSALPPLGLTLNPANRQVTAGGETFELSHVEFAFYWMLAERARSGRPGAHWSDNGIVDELLSNLAQLISPHSGKYTNAESAYRARYTKENFDPAKKHINDAIERALGARRAKPYQITRLGKIAGKRYIRSGLNLPASAIHIEQASLQTPPDKSNKSNNRSKEKMR